MTDRQARAFPEQQEQAEEPAASPTTPIETTPPETAGDGDEALPGQAGETVVVSRPAPGQTVEIQAAAGQTYVLDFPADQARVELQGGNLVLGFDDDGNGTTDSRVVFLDLAAVADSGAPPAFEIAGTEIDSQVLVGQALALAGQDDAPLDDVAAGPQASGGGASVYSDNLGDIVDLLSAQGIIPPTELQFGLVDLEGEITLLDEEEEVAVEQNPALNITKTADGIDGGEGFVADEAGDVITYTITVENTGDQTLTNVVVTDPNADTLVRGGDLVGDNDDELEVGETWSYSATHTVTQAEIDSNGGGDGDIDNTATADSDQTGPDTADETVAIEQRPALNITKTATDVGGGILVVAAAGDVINYAITVENTGNQTLTNVAVTDPDADTLVRGADLVGDNDDELEVGETWSYTATHEVTQAEIDSNGGGDGDIDNTATADSDQTGPDQDSAEVEIMIPTPVLIVGENVDDVDGETTVHRVHSPASDEDSGEILGNDGNDVLIGDVGGSTPGKVMNLALVLDTSNSMEESIAFGGGTTSRIEALDRAVEQALDALAGTAGATVRVHMVSFGTDVKEAATFDIVEDGVVNAAALAAAKDFILATGEDPAAAAQGNTNYEAGFTEALGWFSNPDNTLDDPDFNRTIFISDGLPNRAYRGDSLTDVGTPDTEQLAIDHVLGQVGPPGTDKADTVSEFHGLLGSFEGVAGSVDAIGINTAGAQLINLDQLDGHDADSIEDGDELVAQLGIVTQPSGLDSVGGDVIDGAGGDDLIFGDALFTDDLAADQGVALPSGSGWAVIEDLAASGFFDNDPAQSVEEEIIGFLRDPANLAAYDFGAESGRDGGNDLIDGGGGNDLIFGQEGDDTLIGGIGDDTLDGGSGADVFRWGSETSAGESDVLSGFDSGAGGDLLDFSALLTGVGPGDSGDALDDYLNVTYDGTDTTIAIDANGDGSGFTDLAVTVQGVDLTGGSAVQANVIDSMIANGDLQVA